ncbi:MAG: peptide chain release factor 2 [Tissierellia bacterium]|nr:peptide chain release factor 2 [Tissierellia bacterium]
MDYVLNETIESFVKNLNEIKESLDISGLKDEIQELEKSTLEADFWDDSEKAQKIFQVLNQKKEKVRYFEEVQDQVEEILLMKELTEMEDEDYTEEITKRLPKLEKRIHRFKIETLLKGPYDKNDAILQIHAGAGGLEAQDWAEMLLRMYTRWIESKGYRYQITDYNQDTEGGIKSVTLFIQGENVYGFLKGEKGVHRLVRISPFDSNHKRHTSFASVDVFPKIETENIEIDDKDLKIDTYRASGAGGQHVNKTDSAVRITHIPTGITVQSQAERSQISNRKTAMATLMAKLIQIKEEERAEKIEDIQGKYTETAFGSQIRSYVFHPYRMVKDHRTSMEIGDTDKVMDGGIDPFIDEYLKQE